MANYVPPHKRGGASKLSDTKSTTPESVAPKSQSSLTPTPVRTSAPISAPAPQPVSAQSKPKAASKPKTHSFHPGQAPAYITQLYASGMDIDGSPLPPPEKRKPYHSVLAWTRTEIAHTLGMKSSNGVPLRARTDVMSDEHMAELRRKRKSRSRNGGKVNMVQSAKDSEVAKPDLPLFRG